jgi:hypothetical protein
MRTLVTTGSTDQTHAEQPRAEPDDKCCRSTPRCDGCPYTGGNPNRPQPWSQGCTGDTAALHEPGEDTHPPARV